MVRSAAAARAAEIEDEASVRPAGLPGAWPATPGDATVAKALLIDPDPQTRSAAALHMLRQNGVAIDQAATAEAALEALARRAYSLVILELAAAEYDGADLCRRIVERRGPRCWCGASARRRWTRWPASSSAPTTIWPRPPIRWSSWRAPARSCAEGAQPSRR